MITMKLVLTNVKAVSFKGDKWFAFIAIAWYTILCTILQLISEFKFLEEYQNEARWIYPTQKI